MYYFKTLLLLSIAAAPFLFTSCASNEIGQSKDVNQETIYQEYSAVYDEKIDNCSVTAQFRFAGENGTTLELNDPSKIEMDGQNVKVDSGGFLGAYYRTEIKGGKHLGRHQLLFTDFNNRRYQNSFTIDSFYLTDMPVTVDKAAPMQVFFRSPALKGDDYIELNSEDTDSSFSYSYSAVQTKGYIEIPAKELQRQPKNEFSISATLYRKLPLQQQTKEGGIITTTQITRPIKIKISDPAK